MNLLLRLSSYIYGAVIGLRNWLFDVGLLRSRRVARPVVTVGNLTCGGTGKTPFVSLILDWARTHKVSVGVISRGYGGRFRQAHEITVDDVLTSTFPYGDEPTMIKGVYTDVPVAVAKKRVEAAELLLKNHPSLSFLVSDDGFQHRWLRASLNIVLMDCTAGMRDYNLLPFGKAREGLTGLKRADWVVLTRANLINPVEIAARLEFLRAHFAKPDRVLTAHFELESIKVARPVLLVSGIGNPEGFRRMVSGAQVQIAEHLIFPDHCAYTAKDRDRIRQAFDDLNQPPIVTTLKDAIKLRQDAGLRPSLEVAKLKVRLEGAVDAFYEDLRNLCS